jgi:hypothetical protein
MRAIIIPLLMFQTDEYTGKSKDFLVLIWLCNEFP